MSVNGGTQIAKSTDDLYTIERVAMLLKQVCPGCPKDEFDILIARAKARGMDYFKGDCHFTKRKEKQGDEWITRWTLIGSIDYFRKTAQRAGLSSEMKRLSGEYKITPYYFKGGERLEWHLVPGLFPENPDIAIAEVCVGGIRYTHEVAFQAYVQTFEKNGKTYRMGRWKIDPGGMLCKCAEEGVLRKAYPEEIGGLYADEEMGIEKEDAESTIPKAGEKRDPVSPEQLKEWTKGVKTPEGKAYAENAIAAAEKANGTAPVKVEAEVETDPMAAIEAENAKASAEFANSTKPAEQSKEQPKPVAENPGAFPQFTDEFGVLWPVKFGGKTFNKDTGEVLEIDAPKNRLWGWFLKGPEWARGAFGWAEDQDMKNKMPTKKKFKAFCLWALGTPEADSFEQADMVKFSKLYNRLSRGTASDLGNAVTTWMQKTGSQV